MIIPQKILPGAAARVAPIVFAALVAAPPHAVLGAGGADWPMWRHDAGRTASIPDGIAAAPGLRWKRDFAPPAPAFPNDPRLCFDASYEPVVAGGRMFVPSMVTDTVTALDTGTGAELWTFFADGPVRFAPVAWRDRVYFVSDDGSLYCVRGDDGRLLWRHAPVPPARDGWGMLGNERLISRWPARGGPVLEEGTVYFAAGLWPAEGVVVCAVDAQTGETRWVNRDGGWVKDGLLDHGTRRDGGLSPQGYLAVLGSRLIVPCGRALPALFDRATGRMEPYTSGWGGRVGLAKGTWYACGAGALLFQSGDLYGMGGAGGAPGDRPGDFVSAREFARQMGVPPGTVQRWIDRFKLETATHEGEPGLRVRNDVPITYLSWWTSPPRGAPIPEGERQALETRPRLDIDPANAKELGVFREPILDGTRLYFSAPATDHAKRFRDTNADRRYPRLARYTEIVACDLSRPPEWGATLQGGWGAPTRLVAWSTARFDRLWRLPSPLKLHAKAGPRLYAGGPGTVAAIDPPAAGLPAKVSWQTAIDGTPHRMLVGDGRLFVVTLEGAILCFGSGDTPVITHSHPRDQPSAATPDSVESGRASEILRRAAVRDGYGVVLGPTDGGLVRELVRRSALRWIVLEPDAQRVAAARREFHGLGLYGPRVHVLQGELESAPLPPLFVSLVVTHSVPRSPARLFRLLRPHGGVACLCLPEQDGRAFVRQAGAARLDGADLSCAGAFTLLRRPGPLPGADDWRHESGDAAHTFASRDRHVAPPFGVLWFGGELDRTIPWIEGDPPRLPGESAPSAFAGARSRPRVADGRMFIPIGDDLHAVDVYTGCHLWKRTVRALGDFAAQGSSVYAAAGSSCLRLDAATGETGAEFPAPKGATWREIRVVEGALVATAGKHLLCLDRPGGAPRWIRSARRDGFGFAVGRDRVYCVDHRLANHRRADAPETQEAEIAALDLATGAELWRVGASTPDIGLASKWAAFAPPLPPQLAYSAASDVLLFTRNAATSAAYRGATGRLLWARDVPCKDPPRSFSSYHPPIVLADRFITHPGEVLDLASGEPCMPRLWKGANVELRGCGRALACPRIVTVRDAHASYYDLATGAHAYVRGIRAGCISSLLPAAGLLIAPNYGRHCTCNYPISTSFALLPVPDAPGWDPARAERVP